MEFDIIQDSTLMAKQQVWNATLEYNSKEIMAFEQYVLQHYDTITQEGDIGARAWQLLKKTLKATHGIADHIQNMFKGVLHLKHGEKKKSIETPNSIASKVVPDSRLPKKMQEAEKNLKVPFAGDDNVVVTATPIFIKEITSDESLYIGLFGLNYRKDDTGKLIPVSNDNGVRGLEDNTIIYKNMVYYIKHPTGLSDLTKVVRKASSVISNQKQEIDQSDLRKEIMALIKRSHKFGEEFNAGGTKISIKELTTFSAKINELTIEMDQFQNANHSINHLDGETIHVFNQLVRELETVQHGLNGLSNEIGSVYIIKAQYVNSITDKNELAKFVEMCIDAGVPPKFIAYNTWLIANEEIRGDKVDFNKVPMGQTRMVLFPKDKKIITKIAFSGRGITSNKNEVRMSEFIERSKEPEMMQNIAKIVGHYGTNCAVIDMERIVDKVGKHPNPAMMQTIKNQFKDFTARHKELRLVVTDINDGNIMWSSDREHWVCIDYGLGQRDDMSEKKLNKRAEKKTEAYEARTGTKTTNVTEGDKHDNE